MTKPVKESIEYFDYFDCVKYMESKYGLNLHGHKDDKGEYLNFWHYIVEGGSVNQGSFFTMCSEWIWEEPNEEREWIHNIVRLFLEEFGEVIDPAYPDYKEIIFRTSW